MKGKRISLQGSDSKQSFKGSAHDLFFFVGKNVATVNM